MRTAVEVGGVGGSRQRAASSEAAPDGRDGTARSDVTRGADEASMRAEEILIDAVKAGNAAAFDELVGQHMRRAFAVAYRVLGQRQDAEDVVQEGFLAALLKIDTFERGRPFSPWLLRIVANRALNLRKARALRQVEPIPPGVVSADESPAQAAERSELRRELHSALGRLSDEQRWIVQLFEIDGFSGAEIAQMLEMPEGTVRWHLHGARQALRKVLGHLALRTS